MIILKMAVIFTPFDVLIDILYDKGYSTLPMEAAGTITSLSPSLGKDYVTFHLTQSLHMLFEWGPVEWDTS